MARYLYNNKEFEKEGGVYFYGARLYAPVIGRFGGVDPIAEQFPHVSVFNYAENEPVGHIDLWGLQKYKPKMEEIKEPSDLLSTKMLNNLYEGGKTMFIEFGSLIGEGVDALFDLIPEEGDLTRNDFHDISGTYNGSGGEILSNSGLKAEGTLGTPKAKEGSTYILETFEISQFMPGEAGGILGDASAGGTRATNFIYYTGKLIERTRGVKKELKGNIQLNEDTSFHFGDYEIKKFSPVDISEKKSN